MVDVSKSTLDKFALFCETKKLQAELLEICSQQMTYILHYCEKYNIPIPKREEYFRLTGKTEEILNQLYAYETNQPTRNRDNYQPDRQQNHKSIPL